MGLDSRTRSKRNPGPMQYSNRGWNNLEHVLQKFQSESTWLALLHKHHGIQCSSSSMVQKMAHAICRSCYTRQLHSQLHQFTKHWRNPQVPSGDHSAAEASLAKHGWRAPRRNKGRTYPFSRKRVPRNCG